jgi:ribonuclease HIII
MDLTFPTLYKKTEEMYLKEFGEAVVYKLTENIYREEILKLFQVEIFDSKIVDEKIGELYEEIKENEYIIQITSILEEKYGDKILSFTFLFSYDYFYLFLPIIKDVLNKKDPEIEELLKIL